MPESVHWAFTFACFQGVQLLGWRVLVSQTCGQRCCCVSGCDFLCSEFVGSGWLPFLCCVLCFLFICVSFPNHGSIQFLSCPTRHCLLVDSFLNLSGLSRVPSMFVWSRVFRSPGALSKAWVAKTASCVLTPVKRRRVEQSDAGSALHTV